MIPNSLVIHHTDSDRDKTTITNINNWHKLRWPEFKSSLGFWIGYHFVITGDGVITQTRKENEIGAHSIPNLGKIGISLTGKFETEMPSPEQLTSLQSLLEKLKTTYNITDDKIFGHCELNQTLCPGRNLMSWLKDYRKLSLMKKMLEKLKMVLVLMNLMKINV